MPKICHHKKTIDENQLELTAGYTASGSCTLPLSARLCPQPPSPGVIPPGFLGQPSPLSLEPFPSNKTSWRLPLQKKTTFCGHSARIATSSDLLRPPKTPEAGLAFVEPRCANEPPNHPTNENQSPDKKKKRKPTPRHTEQADFSTNKLQKEKRKNTPPPPPPSQPPPPPPPSPSFSRENRPVGSS